MLTTQNDETSILERIKIARGNTEPQQEPTEEPQIVDVSEDTNPVETTEEVAEVEQTQIEAEEVEEDTEEIEDMYLDLDGEEVSLSQVREWKSGNMMQSDYTRKTTELAEQRKAFEQEQEVFTTNQAKLNEALASLKAAIESDELTTEQLQEMREYEPDAYIKHMEKQNRRKEILANAQKAKVEQPRFNAQEELDKLVSNNPQWVENGKPTKAYEADQKLLSDYAMEKGITAEQFSAFDANMMQMAIDAAKYKAAKVKDAAVVKKVRKAPVVTKPKQGATKGIQDQIKAAEAKLKRTGRIEDAMALKKLKAKLNN